MKSLTIGRVKQALLEEVPEFRKEYDLALSRQAGLPILEYPFFMIVVIPEIRKLLDANKPSDVLNRAFDFFERMARSEDIQVVNLLWIELLEELLGNKDRFISAWWLMGPRTRDLARNAARTLREDHLIPK